MTCLFVGIQTQAGTLIVNEISGFGDNTAATPVGGNPGTTVGQQRSNLFAHVASEWTSILQPTVDLYIDAQFSSLTCTSNSAVLGSAGPTSAATLAGAPFPNTWYPLALAYHAASYQSSAAVISANFNSNLNGNQGCLQGATWYYGYDHNPGAGQIDLYSVILHEMAHGLGFITFVNKSTGRRAYYNDGQNDIELDDVFMKFLRDDSADKSWPEMTDAERATSSVDEGDLVWTGSQLQHLLPLLNNGLQNNYPRMYAPTTLSSGSSVSHFDTNVTYLDNDHELMEPQEESPFDMALTVGLMRDIGWNTGYYDYDSDGSYDADDDFPQTDAADTDTDGDGMPDAWLPVCSGATCGGLTLDGDDDADGVQDVVDADPLDAGNDTETDLPLNQNYKGALFNAGQ